VIVVTEVLVPGTSTAAGRATAWRASFKAPNWRFMDFAKYAIAAS
jgi:hypothetical protein